MKQYREKLEDKTKLDFAIIDGANNEGRGIKFDENDLPFIYFYTNGERNRDKYKFKPEEKSEDISLEKLETFIIETLKENDAKEDL